jgi:hypothetical protein
LAARQTKHVNRQSSELFGHLHSNSGCPHERSSHSWGTSKASKSVQTRCIYPIDTAKQKIDKGQQVKLRHRHAKLLLYFVSRPTSQSRAAQLQVGASSSGFSYETVNKASKPAKTYGGHPKNGPQKDGVSEKCLPKE